MSPTFLDALRLDGKVALVVGAGGDGMGVQTTLALAEAGAAIAGVDWLPENLAALRNRFAGSETRFVPITADVTRPGDVEAAVATAIEAYGQIDLLVNVAGGTRPGHWGSAVDASWAVPPRPAGRSGTGGSRPRRPRGRCGSG